VINKAEAVLVLAKLGVAYISPLIVPLVPDHIMFIMRAVHIFILLVVDVE
jgi:hypothetical protein